MARPLVLLTSIRAFGMIVVACLVSPLPADAQDARDSAFADSVIAHVDSLRRDRDVEGALAALDDAERALDDTHGPQTRRRIHWQRPRLLLQAGEARESLEAADAVIADASRAPVDSTLWTGALYLRARALDALGRGSESTPEYRRLLRMAWQLRDSSFMARGETYLARRLQSEGDLDGAATRLARADTLFGAIGDEQQRVANLVLAGLIELRRGNAEAGVASWRRCIEDSREWTDRSTYVGCLTNVATYESLHGDPAEAMRCWREARDVSLASGARWRNSLRPTTNLALLQADLGRFDLAIDELESALALTREKGYADLEGSVLLSLAEVEQMRGDPRRTLTRYRAARRVADAHGDHVDRFWAKRGIAMALAGLDSTAAAVALLDELDADRDALAPQQQMHLDVGRAEVLTQVGRGAEAVQVARAAELFAKESDASRQRLELILVGADAWASLANDDSTIAWLERAATVYEAVREVPTDPRWREQRSTFAHRIYPELARKKAARQDLDVASIHALLQPYKARTLLERITRPGETIASDELASVSVSTIQGEVLEPGELFLDVYFGPRNGFVVAVSIDSCALFPLQDTEDLDERMRRLAELMRTPAPDEDGAFLELASSRIAEVLVPPRLRDWPAIDRILVSPDGPMLALPLRGLLPAGDAWRDVGIQRVPSVGILARWRLREDASSARRLIALEAAGPGLSGAVREVDGLAKRFVEVDRRVLGTGPDPVTDDGWSGAAVVHVASHARFVDDDPWRSSILFDARDVDGADPNRAAGTALRCLTATEVLSMRIDADLVVLSACETLGEERFRGAGALGLSGAFLSAGAHAVLATLWPVDDETTADLMSDFYREVGRGHAPVDALTRAQAAMRARPGRAHPFHWAGFVLVGDDPGTLGLRVRRAAFPWIPLGVALGVVALLASRRRRRDDAT